MNTIKGDDQNHRSKLLILFLDATLISLATSLATVLEATLEGVVVNLFDSTIVNISLIFCWCARNQPTRCTDTITIFEKWKNAKSKAAGTPELPFIGSTTSSLALPIQTQDTDCYPTDDGTATPPPSANVPRRHMAARIGEMAKPLSRLACPVAISCVGSI